jgi:hypothetical protein
MQNVTNIERFEIAKGSNEAWKEGWKEGLHEGRIIMVSLVLDQRFGELSDAVVNRLKNASEDQHKEWLISAITAPSLEDVFKGGL